MLLGIYPREIDNYIKYEQYHLQQHGIRNKSYPTDLVKSWCTHIKRKTMGSSILTCKYVNIKLKNKPGYRITQSHAYLFAPERKGES